jgi:ferredoxin
MRLESRDSASKLLEASALLIDEELCLNLRGRVMLCTSCQQQCESEALTLSVDAVDLDSECCTGCGGCIPHCPAGVMHLSGFSPLRFLHSLEEIGGSDEKHIHCSESTDGGGGVVIPCHKLLDARLFAAAQADGAQCFSLHGLSRCEQCAKGDASAHLDEVEVIMQQWFGECRPEIRRLQPGEESRSTERLHEDQPQMNRRNFLRLMGAQVTSGAATWIMPLADEREISPLPFYQGGGEAQRPVVYQQLLAARVEQLGWKQGLPLPWRPRRVDLSCSACMVCGERCPSGALQSLERGGSKELSFENALCTDCGLCVRLCPEDAVAPAEIFDAGLLASPRSVLMRRTMQQCSNCGQMFDVAQNSDSLCVTCSNEQDLDEEWLEMLQG